MARARTIDARVPITHVMAFHEYNVDLAAIVAADLGLPFHDVETVRSVRDKHRMRQLLDAADSPRWAVATDEESLRRAVVSTGLPCIVKPRDGSGSDGVGLLGSLHDAGRLSHPLLVEQLLRGREVSVEAFSEGGVHKVVGVTAKHQFAGSLVEEGHMFPLLLDPVDHEAVGEVVRRTLSTLGVSSGPSHTEVFLTGSEPVVVETHLRAGGDRIPEMVQDVTGTSLVDLWIRQCLGERILDEVPEVSPGTDHHPTYSATWYRGANATAILAGVGDLRSVVAQHRAAGLDVRSLELRVSVGDVVRVPTRSGDRLLVGRACAASPDAAREAARALVAAVPVELVTSELAPSVTSHGSRTAASEEPSV
ncbi:MAG: ATP-grasp domain-containing protein [Nocardioides sp.]|nr:ATP-grasp domain-containing protein [Nocardioides sp.]